MIADEDIALLGEYKYIFLIFLYNNQIACTAYFGDPTSTCTDFLIPNPQSYEDFCNERGDFALT